MYKLHVTGAGYDKEENNKFGKGKEGIKAQDEEFVTQPEHVATDEAIGGVRKSTRKRQTNRNWVDYVAYDYCGNQLFPLKFFLLLPSFL